MTGSMLRRATLLAASFVLVSGMPAGAHASPSEALGLGDKAPMSDTKMTTTDGREVSIESVKGEKGTLVVFTCNACPWVKKWEGRIAKLGNEASKRGIGVIAINANDPDKNPEDGFGVMKLRAKERGMKFAYAMDATSDVARAFGATRTPEAFLFDADGKLVYHGTIDDNADNAKAVKDAYLANAVSAVASGKPVRVAETKALGCGIKFRAPKTES